MLSKTPKTSKTPPKKAVASVDQHVALRLIAARKAAGKTQTQAGDALDLTFQQVQKYERGTNRIAPSRLAVLAALYGKPIAWFFEGAPGPEAIEGRDLGSELIGTLYGAELARTFMAIPDKAMRRVVLDVAIALRGSADV